MMIPSASVLDTYWWQKILSLRLYTGLVDKHGYAIFLLLTPMLPWLYYSLQTNNTSYRS